MLTWNKRCRDTGRPCVDRGGKSKANIPAPDQGRVNAVAEILPMSSFDTIGLENEVFSDFNTFQDAGNDGSGGIWGYPAFFDQIMMPEPTIDSAFLGSSYMPAPNIASFLEDMDIWNDQVDLLDFSLPPAAETGLEGQRTAPNGAVASGITDSLSNGNTAEARHAAFQRSPWSGMSPFCFSTLTI